MDESVSPVMLLYGLAVIVAVGKACTLFVWRTLPKPRPPLRQEMIEAWQRRKAHARAAKEPVHEPQETSLDPNPTDGVTSK
jgi:hypothetical protein